MARQLLKLRYVPRDELEELHELLEQHEIEFYETSAGNWGISMPALWVRDDEELPRAKALLDEYSEARFRRARDEYEALKRAGKARTFMDILRENPVRTVLYLCIVVVLIYFSTVPFLSMTPI